MPPSELITFVRVETIGGHDLVHVWNRGGKAGVLTVQAGDGAEVASRLMGSAFVPADKGMGFCYKCRHPVRRGEEVWGYHDAGDAGVWTPSIYGELYHTRCV